MPTNPWDYASEREIEEGREAYDGLDPKHPDWAGLAAERADLDRKREKEEGP